MIKDTHRSFSSREWQDWNGNQYQIESVTHFKLPKSGEGGLLVHVLLNEYSIFKRRGQLLACLIMAA
jgi:hypothetical protein